MSTGKDKRPSKALKEKDSLIRVKELLEQFEGDRKKTALAMDAEGYSSVEIGTAFKTATTKGISGRTWKLWKQEAEGIQKLGPEAATVVKIRDKVFESETLVRFKTMTNESQTRILSFGMYVSDVVTPQVPAATPKDKVKNTINWLSRAVEAFQPEKMEEIEEFGATAYLAAMELKRQMNVFMDWAAPSKRLENLALKALYSPNPFNKEAFKLLLDEIIRTIHEVPRFERGPKLEEIPGIIKGYASARGISEEQAEQRMSTAIKKVGGLSGREKE